MSELITKGKLAKEASFELSHIASNIKNEALKQVAALLIDKEKEIIEVNSIDVENAKSKGVSDAAR